jgi:nitroreductase
VDLHPLLAQRWSPAAFDESHEIGDDEVDALLEAARWAPSAGNSQPWAFVIGRRGDDVHARLVRHLAASSRRWAPSAALLVANLSHRYVEGTDWEYSEFAHYDLGQAVAHMTFQAQAGGLAVRQFRAFDRAAIAAELAVPENWEVTTMAAIGRGVDAVLATPGRVRRSLADVRWPGGSTGQEGLDVGGRGEQGDGRAVGEVEAQAAALLGGLGEGRGGALPAQP